MTRALLVVVVVVVAVAVLAPAPALAEEETDFADPAAELKERRQESVFLAVTTMILVFTLAACLLAAYRLRLTKIDRVLHESGAAILIGVAVGLVMHLAKSPEQDHLKAVVSFNPETFFLVLLPPIIFNAGYGLKRKNFFRNFGSIIVFAVIGTLISTFVIGLLLYVLGAAGACHPLSGLDSMIFGALISAVDPVTVIAIFETLQTDITLHALVFGESILNDAVCIVLVRTLQSFPQDLHISGGVVGEAIGTFFGIFLGSFAVGVVWGLLTSLVFKYARVREYPHIETGLFFLLSYVPYLLAESLEFSGIVSLLFAGIVMSHYTYYNLSNDARVWTRQFYHVLAHLAETFVFMYIGLAMFTMTHAYKPWLIVYSVVLCLVARGLNIFPLTWLVNLRRKTIRISWPHRTLLWWSGLRGAIAFALSTSVLGPDAHVIITTTLVTVLFTVLVLGGGAYTMVRRMGIRSAEETEAHVEAAIIDSAARGPATEFKKELRWHGFDRLHIKPVLIRAGAMKDRDKDGHARPAVGRAPPARGGGGGGGDGDDGDALGIIGHAEPAGVGAELDEVELSVLPGEDGTNTQ